MSSNTLGTRFQITNWGESHGKALGVVIDGCPSLLELSEKDIQKDLDRRKPGQSEVTTPRKENDTVEILSGVFEGKTTGAPISLIIYNKDHRSEDYTEMMKSYRPGHADFTFDKKYGIRDPFGGGRTSARVTAGHVAAGAIAKKILKEKLGVDIIGYVHSVKDIVAHVDPSAVLHKDVEANIVRCPDPKAAETMIENIKAAKTIGDSLGGVVACVVRNVPVGLGEPIFDKVEAELAKAMMSINATKGFEMGSGFAGTTQFGSQHNDSFESRDGIVQTKTNNAGGVLGGITNGMPLVFRVAFKPTSTILQKQQTVSAAGESVTLENKGRHDPCVVPRAVPIVEALAACVILDLYLRSKGGRLDDN